METCLSICIFRNCAWSSWRNLPRIIKTRKSNHSRRRSSQSPPWTNANRIQSKTQICILKWTKNKKKKKPYVLGGIGLGAIIHGFVPQEFFMTYISQYSILSVPIATIIGIPIYAGCSTIVPVIFGITANGVPLGTSLAFMMGIAGLSLPEAVILKRVMTTKLLATFFASVGVGIILIGYLFNFVSM